MPIWRNTINYVKGTFKEHLRSLLNLCNTQSFAKTNSSSNPITPTRKSTNGGVPTSLIDFDGELGGSTMST